MARIRSIKPELWDHAQLNRASLLARLTFIGLISFSDDEGRGKADPELVWGRLHSGQHPNVKRGWLGALSELAGLRDDDGPLVVFYEIAGARYYWLPGFNKQQRIDEPSKSKLPPPPNSGNVPVIIREDSSLDQGSGIKDQGGEGNPPPESKRYENVTPPPPQEDPTFPEDVQTALDDAKGARGLATLYKFCRSPGYIAKVRAIEDLIRIGVSQDLIASYATTQEARAQDFYDITKTLKEKTNGKRGSQRDGGDPGYRLDKPYAGS